jgi:hypothetical protein
MEPNEATNERRIFPIRVHGIYFMVAIKLGYLLGRNIT